MGSMSGVEDDNVAGVGLAGVGRHLARYNRITLAAGTPLESRAQRRYDERHTHKNYCFTLINHCQRRFIELSHPSLNAAIPRLARYQQLDLSAA